MTILKHTIKSYLIFSISLLINIILKNSLFYTIIALNMNHFITILIISIITHFIFFKLIINNHISIRLNVWFNKDLKNNLNRYTLYYFIIITIISFTLKYNINILFLDDIVVHTKIGDVDISVTGNYLNFIFNNLGDAGVFAFGSRLGYAIIAKTKINTAAKIGLTVSTGSMFLSSYKITRMWSTHYPIHYPIPDPEITATISLKNVAFETTTNYVLPQHPYLDLFFGTNPVKFLNGARLDIQSKGGYKIITSDIDISNSPIIQQALKLRPDFFKNKLETLINVPSTSANASSSFTAWSPLENNDNIINFLINIINNHLVLEIAGIYLLFMLGVIFICKSLSKNLEFKFLSKFTIFKWSLGSYVNRFLKWYINLWQKSSNIWIFIIVFTLIFSHCISTYSLIRMLMLLKSLN